LILCGACAVVIAIYGFSAQSGLLELLGRNAANSYYNLLVEGFQDGHLSLRKAVPAGLANLADPYDPAASHPYRYAPYILHDLSFYRGKLYLYFGVSPALLLFWPWALLTGHYLLHRSAVALFCTVGYLATVGITRAIWRRYFPEISPWVAAASALALGLATSAPILLQRADVYQVSISCSYALTMLALAAVWLALHRPAHRGRWLAAGSLAFGLAAGARPTALFSALILVLPAIEAARSMAGKSQVIRLLIAAAAPLLFCGLGLLLYNYMRFDDPFEFGQRYQLATDRQDTANHFSPGYLWFNFRLYFLEPVPWREGFPFVGKVSPPPPPEGHGTVEDPFGILTAIPLTWLALAAPLAWRHQPSDARSTLRRFVAATALLFLLSAAPLLLFYWCSSRYELEFLPSLVLLAIIGIFGLERALADQPAWRKFARSTWSLMLGYSIAFNLLAGVESRAEERYVYGSALLDHAQTADAIAEFRSALHIKPGYAEAHNSLGVALARSGRMPEAIAEFQASLQASPSLADAHTNLGNSLAQMGQAGEAVAQYEQVCRLQPNSAVAHYNLAYGLQLLGRRDEAMEQYQEAVRLNPQLARRAP
jgi:hypothetical protein